ncbi:uncharacterized protein LOC109710753 isoform X1 [Ananas comosus]|uniref:Uncharacterized protein LOC109710753 isoform X1 n=1 Tax=Ananas comosus TaxID=4615 RepID=A0A6P5EZ18_ANACO|nr:uncharacterized protein LOC109710753 isoform X1 [Ananas comosus]
MEEATTPEPVCAKEALDLLNCVAASPFDRDTCLRLVDALRTCVLHKVRWFSLCCLFSPPFSFEMNGKYRTSQEKEIPS